MSKYKFGDLVETPRESKQTLKLYPISNVFIMLERPGEDFLYVYNDDESMLLYFGMDGGLRDDAGAKRRFYGKPKGFIPIKNIKFESEVRE